MTSTVGAHMTPSPHTIDSSSSLDEVKLLMANLGIRHLPVVQDGKIYGLITDRDLKLMYATEPLRAPTMTVRDACLTEVYAVENCTPLADVVEHMARLGMGSAVVLNGSEIRGIFTVTDACRILGTFLRRSDGPL